MYLWNENIIHRYANSILIIIIIIFILNRNLKPDSIYLRGENNEQNCSLIISDIIPSSVTYDLRMRTRLPRRMYYNILKKIFTKLIFRFSRCSFIYSTGNIRIRRIYNSIGYIFIRLYTFRYD
jgi:hypothetical protein